MQSGARPPRMAANLRICLETRTNARPPTPRTGRQPHRRRRGGRASRERGQGTRGERDRRRCQPDRYLHRRWRQAEDRDHRRRWRHDCGRSGAGRRPPRHLQARRRGPAADQDARVPRRGPALDRRGGKTLDHHAPCERTACLAAFGRRRREVRRDAGSACPRHPGRGRRSLLRDAGAAEIPENRPHRGGSDPRDGAAACDGAPRHRLHAGRRRARARHLGRGAAGRARPAHSARRYPRRGFPHCGHRCPRGARGRLGRGLCRRAVPDARRMRSGNISSSTAGPCATS